VDPHFKGIPCLASLTARSLARGDLQMLGRQSYRALHTEILGASTLDELAAHFLQRLDIARCQGDTNTVDFLQRISETKMQETEQHTGPSPKSLSPFW
jgi:hypothetical protein